MFMSRRYAEITALLTLSTCMRTCDAVAQAVHLDAYVESTGARCLDGSPALYWFEPASDSAHANDWVLDIMGGAWCEDLQSCASRAYDPGCVRGSSNASCFAAAVNQGNSIPGVNYSSVMNWTDIPSCLGSRWCGGLMDANASANPLTAGWNHVELHYCDGASFVGDNENVTYVQYANATLPLYFRGRRNFDAIVSDLIQSRGLAQARYVVLTGNSAGGLATYWAIDHFASILRTAAAAGSGEAAGPVVVAAPDSGFFFYDDSYPAWGTGLRWAVTAQNGTSHLNAGCVAAKVGAGGDPTDCAFPEQASPYISTPLFVMNSRLDPALDSISGGENGNNVTNVNRLGARLQQLVTENVLNRNQNAAFLTSCHQHCGQWATDQQLGPNGQFNDFNVTIAGTTAIPAFATWFKAIVNNQLPSQAMTWIQETPYPCATCCSGGQV